MLGSHFRNGEVKQSIGETATQQPTGLPVDAKAIAERFLKDPIY
jgi:hypothetical protein